MRTMRAVRAMSVPLLGCAFLAGCHAKQDDTGVHQTRVSQVGAMAEHQGLWDKGDYVYLQGIKSGQPVSDKDFNWMMGKLSGKTVGPGFSYPAIVSFIEDKIIAVKLSPQQQDELKNTTIPLLSKPETDANSWAVKEWACAILEHYPDPRASGQLHTLLTYNEPWVRRHAALALVAAGENVAVPPKPTKW